MKRFQVELDKCGAYKIVDTRAIEFKMPAMAVSIYFGTKSPAHLICDTMNTEWDKFQEKPF